MNRRILLAGFISTPLALYQSPSASPSSSFASSWLTSFAAHWRDTDPLSPMSGSAGREIRKGALLLLNRLELSEQFSAGVRCQPCSNLAGEHQLATLVVADQSDSNPFASGLNPPTTNSCRRLNFTFTHERLRFPGP